MDDVSPIFDYIKDLKKSYDYIEVNNLSKKITAFILIGIMILNLSACTTFGNKVTEKRFQASFLDVFDTVTIIIGYADNEENFTKSAQMIHDELLKYHQLYDIYNNYDGVNNIKTINDNAGKAPVVVDQSIIDVLKLSKEWYNKTNKKFNVALGPVLAVWHQYREAGRDDPDNAKLPSMDLLKEKAGHTNIEDVIIDEANSTVYLKDSEMSLDVGGIAKGYATELAANYAKDHGFINGMISVGGNVRTIGSKLDGKNNDKTWSVGIQNPDLESSQTNLFVLGLNDYSLVTSGVYERFYVVDGKQYHHIIDPETLMPANYFLSVSIVTKDSGKADALAKIFTMPYEDGLKLIESEGDAEALWVFPDGSVKFSSGFEKFIKQDTN